MFLLFFSASFLSIFDAYAYKRQKWVKNCRGKNQNYFGHQCELTKKHFCFFWEGAKKNPQKQKNPKVKLFQPPKKSERSMQ